MKREPHKKSSRKPLVVLKMRRTTVNRALWEMRQHLKKHQKRVVH
jgi:hypothetical protein